MHSVPRQAIKRVGNARSQLSVIHGLVFVCFFFLLFCSHQNLPARTVPITHTYREVTLNPPDSLSLFGVYRTAENAQETLHLTQSYFNGTLRSSNFKILEILEQKSCEPW
uniref:Uncharacterized protein n=1 Tax=Anopheles culicifacies TaxID=139723 RepID=A0A182MDG2_9DIPT